MVRAKRTHTDAFEDDDNAAQHSTGTPLNHHNDRGDTTPGHGDEDTEQKAKPLAKGNNYPFYNIFGPSKGGRAERFRTFARKMYHTQNDMQYIIENSEPKQLSKFFTELVMVLMCRTSSTCDAIAVAGILDRMEAMPPDRASDYVPKIFDGITAGFDQSQGQRYDRSKEKALANSKSATHHTGKVLPGSKRARWGGEKSVEKRHRFYYEYSFNENDTRTISNLFCGHPQERKELQQHFPNVSLEDEWKPGDNEVGCWSPKPRDDDTPYNYASATASSSPESGPPPSQSRTITPKRARRGGKQKVDVETPATATGAGFHSPSPIPSTVRQQRNQTMLQNGNNGHYPYFGPPLPYQQHPQQRYVTTAPPPSATMARGGYYGYNAATADQWQFADFPLDENIYNGHAGTSASGAMGLNIHRQLPANHLSRLQTHVQPQYHGARQTTGQSQTRPQQQQKQQQQPIAPGRSDTTNIPGYVAYASDDFGLGNLQVPVHNTTPVKQEGFQDNISPRIDAEISQLLQEGQELYDAALYDTATYSNNGEAIPGLNPIADITYDDAAKISDVWDI